MKEKIMPLDLLASIKGARASDAVDELFKVIKQAVPEDKETSGSIAEEDCVEPVSLREDVVKNCPEEIKQSIIENFPEKKNGYLVVPRVIEE